MGFELVYCWKCSKRLTEVDFKGGKALRVGIHTSCLKCAEDLLAQLPPDQRASILSPSKGNESATRRSSSRLAKPATPRSVTAVRRKASPPRASFQIPLIVGGVLAFAVLTGFLVAGSGNEDDPEPDNQIVMKDRRLRPVTVKESESPSVDTETPPIGGGSGFHVEPKRVTEAKEALQKAVDHRKANPEDLPGIVKLYEQAIWACEKTPFEEEAKKAHAEALARLNANTRSAQASLNEEIQPLVDREEYQKALDLLATARNRDASEDWANTIEKKSREIREAAEGNYNRMRGMAISARRYNDEEEVERIRKVVRNWGIPAYIEKLDTLLSTK
jgi:hypothetical protein